MGQALIFFGTAFSTVLLIHYYLWRRLVRSTTVSRRARRIGAWIMAGLAVLVIATFAGSRFLPRPALVPLAWVGYLWVALMFYLVLSLAVLELPALGVRLAMRRRAWRAGTNDAEARVLVGVSAAVADQRSEPGLPPERPITERRASTTAVGDSTTDLGDSTTDLGDSTTEIGRSTSQRGGSDRDGAGGADQDRRLFLARAVAITAGLASAGVVASGVGAALGPPRVKRVQIPLAKLPRSADGLRVALVSDIHLGPLRGVGHTRRIVDLVNGVTPDCIAIVGDLVDGSVEELGWAAAPLRELRSRYGAFFVTGNHEYYSGYEEWNAEVARLGVRPLRNERVELPAGLDLAGVTDVTGTDFGDGPDFGRALDGRDPARAVVLLAHQPIQAHQAAARGVDLQLSGHTHGGQMFPFNAVVRLAQQPVLSGLGTVDGMPVYVTNGAGFWGPPVRVGAPADITVVELRAR